MLELTRYELAWLVILTLSAGMFAYCVVGAA